MGVQSARLEGVMPSFEVPAYGYKISNIVHHLHRRGLSVWVENFEPINRDPKQIPAVNRAALLYPRVAALVPEVDRCKTVIGVVVRRPRSLEGKRLLNAYCIILLFSGELKGCHVAGR